MPVKRFKRASSVVLAKMRVGDLLCQHCLHFFVEDIRKWRWVAGMHEVNDKKQPSLLWRKEKKSERNSVNPVHCTALKAMQGKVKFPLGVYRVRIGGWVGLAGVRESKMCSEKLHSNSLRFSCVLVRLNAHITHFSQDNQLLKDQTDFSLHLCNDFPQRLQQSPFKRPECSR